MEWHPYAKLFPMLSDEELEALADDIREHGLRNAIVVDADDRIIDGRNRYRACQMAGVEPTIEAMALDDREILAFVISTNLRRRHLNESQRADVAAKIATTKVGAPAGNRRASKTEAPIGASESNSVSRAEAAKLLNVSERSVDRAAKVQAKGSDELKAAVAAGEVTVNRAERIAELPKPEQAAAIKENPREIKEGPPSNGAATKPSKAIELAEDAINCLKRIPKNDAQRKRGFQIVADFCKHNMRGA